MPLPTAGSLWWPGLTPWLSVYWDSRFSLRLGALPHLLNSRAPFHCTEPSLTPSVWHKLTTYEYIVQHRPPQEATEAHRQLESCPPKMRPIQVQKWPKRLRG